MQAKLEKQNFIFTRPSSCCIAVSACNKRSPASQYANHEARLSIRMSWWKIQTTVHLFSEAIISSSHFGKWGQVWSASVSPLFPGTITMLRYPCYQQEKTETLVKIAYFVLSEVSALFSRIFCSRAILTRETCRENTPYYHEIILGRLKSEFREHFQAMSYLFSTVLHIVMNKQVRAALG